MRFFVLASLISFTTASLNCFIVHPNHAVSNADPIAELFRVSPGECLNYCIYQSAQAGDGCVSVVYHKRFNTCQLFGQDGNANGAAVLEIESHDLYIRSSYQGECQDTILPHRGYKQWPKNYVEPVSTNSSRPAPAKLEASQVQHGGNQVIDLPEFIDQEFPKPQALQEPVSTTTMVNLSPTGVKAEFKNPTHEYKCPKNQKLSYFNVYAAKLVTDVKPHQLRGVDLESCFMYCGQNINSMGTKQPCYSVNYEASNEVCSMYGKQDRSSWAQLTTDPTYNFADKFCMETKKDCTAEIKYSVFLYMQMHKKIISYFPGLNSKVACLAECVNDGECKAVTYKKGLCILHSANPLEDEELIVQGSEQTMVIVNECRTAEEVKKPIQAVSHDDPTAWQEWSLCQFGTRGQKLRVRYRDCNECETDMEAQRC